MTDNYVRDLDPDVAEEKKRLDRLRQNPRRLFHLFFALALPYFRYDSRSKLDLLFVTFLGLLQSAVSVIFSYISRDFWTALQKKDVGMFWRQIFLFGGMLLVALPVIVWYSYAKDCFSLRWRKWLTRKLLREYFADRNYYEIDQRNTVDNVDQRICEDIDHFAFTSVSLILTVLMSTIDLINFSIILLTIYPQLFLVLIAYSGIGTLLTVLIGRQLISFNFAQLQLEADFRFSVIRVRENSESIAFYNGENREKYEVQRRFDEALDNDFKLILCDRDLSFFTTAYSYIIQILPLSVIAPLYFQSKIELGVVSQAQQAFRHILDDLSLVISEFERLSAFSAGIDRLGELEEFLYLRFKEVRSKQTEVHTAADSDEDSGSGYSFGSKYGSPGSDSADSMDVRAIARHAGYEAYARREVQNREDLALLEAGNADVCSYIRTKVVDAAPGEPPKIIIENLTLQTPDAQHRTLFENLSLRLENGERMLIVGPSGTGKSSFLRALAGLWYCGQGVIQRPSFRSMFFLPQKPYCTLGSLREQLVYPKKVSAVHKTDEELQEALDKVDLSLLPARMGGLDAMRSWSTVLSLGEQQRLAFARVLIGKPALVVCDESSSALDLDAEHRVYSELRNSGTTFISVGHRPSLVRFHDVLLRLGSPGQECTVTSITPDMYDRSL